MSMYTGPDLFKDGREVFVTKDSGQRQEFTSGMVRDTETGKPRFDLIFDGPVTREVLRMVAPEKISAINAFFEWYDAPSLTKAAIAIIEIAKLEGGLFVFLSRCSALMARGAIKYTEQNWMQAAGEPELKRFVSSAARHFGQYILGFVDEDHSAATWFNLNGAEYTKGRLK